MMYNSLHEIQVYCTLLNIKERDFKQLFELLQCTNEYLKRDQVRIHPVYYHQISKLSQTTEQKLSSFHKQTVYKEKELVADVRDLAILLSTQTFPLDTVPIHCEPNGPSFSFHQVFSNTFKNTISHSFIFSTLKCLTDMWSSEISDKIKMNQNSSFFGLPFISITREEERDVLDYLLLFFNGLMYGNRCLYKDLKELKLCHQKLWFDFSTEYKENKAIEEGTNFIYSCLLPMLDNVGVISINENKYYIFLRAIRCLFSCAGYVNTFYTNISKYNIKFVDDAKTKIKIKNEEFLHRLILNWDSKSIISSSALKDLCHFYGYDNIWIGSKIYGQILITLITQDIKDVYSGIGKNISVLLHTYDFLSVLPRHTHYNAPFLCAVVNQTDLYGILKQLYYSIVPDENLDFHGWYLNFLSKVVEFQKEMCISDSVPSELQTKDALMHTFDSVLSIVENFVKDTNYSSAAVNLDTSERDKEISVSVTFTMFPQTFVIKKSFTYCTLSTLLLIGATACAFQEGLMGHYVKKIVRNVPSIHPTTHWVDKLLYFGADTIAGKEQMVIEGKNILSKMLSLHSHGEWTPVLIGLINILSLLVYDDCAKTTQSVTFLQLVARVFKTKKSSKAILNDSQVNILEKRAICSEPAEHLFQIYSLYIAYNKKHYFIPLLRSTCLFYGGIVLLRKINKCISTANIQHEEKPSRELGGGFKDLMNCFMKASHIQDEIRVKFKEFIGSELFAKHENVLVVSKWDFTYPFVTFFKQPEEYSNVMYKQPIKWMK